MDNQDSAEFLYELQSEGHRLTRLRREVLDIFSRRSEPLLFEDLKRLLSDQSLKVHRATLYRELDFLMNKKMIVSVTLADGKARYESAELRHHHHAVCLQCKKIEDIELEDDTTFLEKLIKNKHNFKITQHALEFFGVCGDCKNV
jgi:Fe2+ or Zn2+ uptake regulation protein